MFSDPADTPPKTLILDALPHLQLKPHPLKHVTLLRVQDQASTLAPLNPPLLGLIDSDQGRKLVIIRYSGKSEFLVRVVNTDSVWSSPVKGGTPLPPPIVNPP